MILVSPELLVITGPNRFRFISPDTVYAKLFHKCSAHTHRCPKNLHMETMKLWLKEREASGQSLVWTKVCLENRTYALAIRRRFRSWKKALKAAGLQVSE